MLGCTPGHIPRYMGQTSNNNDFCDPCYDSCYDSCYAAMTPVMPAMIPVMLVMDFCYDTCYDSRYVLPLCLLCVPVMTTL